MAATDATSVVRYSNTLNKTVYVCPAMADYNNPTRAELNAGTRIDKLIPKAGLAGFSASETTIQGDDIRTGAILPVHDGVDYSSGSTITGYADKSGGADIRTYLPRYTNQYVVVFDSTDTAGLKMDVFPVFVGSHTKARTGLATIDVAVTFTDVPAENVTVPA